MATTELEIIEAELARREQIRSDPYYFTKALVESNGHEWCDGWFPRRQADTMLAFIRAVEEKRSPRLIVNMPPGFGKSYFWSRAFCPFTWLHHPNWDFIQCTYNGDFATDFGKEVSAILASEWYSALGNTPELRVDANSALFKKNTKGGQYVGAGIGGSVSGRRAHILVFDDPYRNSDDADSAPYRKSVQNFFTSTAMSRLHPGGGIVLIQTRWHEDDISGHILQAAIDDPENAEHYLHLSLPAVPKSPVIDPYVGEVICNPEESIFPERFSKEQLLKIRNSYKALGDMRSWNALYMQEPTPDEGEFYKKDYLDAAVTPVEKFPDYKNKAANLKRFTPADFAVTNNSKRDATCIWPCVLDDDDVLWFLPEYFHGREEVDVTVPLFVRLSKAARSKFGVVEAGVIYNSVAPSLRKAMHTQSHSMHVETPACTMDKAARSTSALGRLATGKLKLPDIPFVHEVVIPELLAFMGGGKHDDVADTIAWGAYVADEQGAPRAAKPKEPEPEIPIGSALWWKKIMKPAASGRKTNGLARIPPTGKNRPRR